MIRIVTMELAYELIFVFFLRGSGHLALSAFSPNFDFSTCRDRSALPNDLDDGNCLLNLIRSGVTLSCLCLSRFVTRGMLGRSRGLHIRSLDIRVMHRHGLRCPFCTMVETRPELVRFVSQSNHIVTNQWHNHNMLGNSEITEENDIPRRGASAKESRQSKARNSIPYEDSETSSHKRKSQEKETHFEEQFTAIQNSYPKRQAVNRASRHSSCLSSIIEGNNIGYIPNSITGHDAMVSTHMGAQPSPESISTQPLNSVSSIENAKRLFNSLIALPLEDLSNPENETSMRKALSILADNHSLFSKKQAEQIFELLFDFPALVHRWREYSRSHMRCQKSSAETEKIRYLVKTSGRDEDSVFVRDKAFEKKEKELMRQLEAVEKEAEIAEKKTEKSKHAKDLMEKEAHRNKEERLTRIAAAKMNNLLEQWAKLRSFFI